MNMSKILPVIVLGAASLTLSTSVMADNLFTGIGNATSAVVTGVGHATTYVVGGVVHGTEHVVHSTTHMWGGNAKVHHVKHTHYVHQS